MRHIACWTQASTPDESLSIISKLALSHALEGGEQGKYIASCITSGDFPSLCDVSLDYETTTAHHAGNCRQALAYFTKYEPLDLGRDRREVAIIKFNESEVACRETNDLFRMRAQGSFYFEPWVESVFHRAQQKIAHVLGDCPSLANLRYRFGPGATTLTKKSQASVVEKLQSTLTCSEDLVHLLPEMLAQMPMLTELHTVRESQRELHFMNGTLLQTFADVPVVITDGIVDFVPKDAKTLRTIIKEGSLNTMIQAALGDWMAKRLRASGIDLRDQTHNQNLALRGSLDGSYATLDLSSASDTISTELVYTLLPIDWALLLDSARSSQVYLDGKGITLEKFSSMGNGFTFPLETLIFWALSSSASDDNWASVYGDDIIVTTGSVERVMRILEISGFTLNKKKSYWTGPFRESCGADYIRGIDIRPVYQKKLISPAELYRLHNFYYRRGDMDRANLVKGYLNPCFTNYGPDGYGDGHLLGDWRPRPHKKRDSHGYGGALFDSFKLSGQRDDRALRPGDRVLPFYTTYICEDAYVSVLSEPRPTSLEALPGYLGRFRRFQSAYAPEPIPERKSPVDGTAIKEVSLPGTKGYRLVSIYTFDTGR